MQTSVLYEAKSVAFSNANEKINIKNGLEER